jgi:hypothetical protein
MAADPMACYCLERDLNKKKKKKQSKEVVKAPRDKGRQRTGTAVISFFVSPPSLWIYNEPRVRGCFTRDPARRSTMQAVLG